MATELPRTPHLRDPAAEARRAREQREADALRENLRRRKAQARARAEPTPATPPAVLPEEKH